MWMPARRFTGEAAKKKLALRQDSAPQSIETPPSNPESSGDVIAAMKNDAPSAQVQASTDARAPAQSQQNAFQSDADYFINPPPVLNGEVEAAKKNDAPQVTSRPYDRSQAFANPRMPFQAQAAAPAPIQQDAPQAFVRPTRMPFQPQASPVAPEPVANSRMPFQPRAAAPVQQDATQAFVNPRMSVPFQPRASAAAPVPVHENASQSIEDHSLTQQPKPELNGEVEAVNKENAPQAGVTNRPYDRSQAFANPRMPFQPRATAPVQQDAPQPFANPRMPFQPQAQVAAPVLVQQDATQAFVNPRMSMPFQPRASTAAPVQQNAPQYFANPRMPVRPQALPASPDAPEPVVNSRMPFQPRTAAPVQQNAPQPFANPRMSVPFQPRASAAAPVPGQQNAPQPFANPRMTFQPRAAAPVQQDDPQPFEAAMKNLTLRQDSASQSIETQPPKPEELIEEVKAKTNKSLDQELKDVKEKVIKALRHFTNAQYLAISLNKLYGVDFDDLLKVSNLDNVEDLFKRMGFSIDENNCLNGFSGKV